MNKFHSSIPNVHSFTHHICSINNVLPSDNPNKSLKPIKYSLYFMLALNTTMCEQVQLSRTYLYKIRVGFANSS